MGRTPWNFCTRQSSFSQCSTYVSNASDTPCPTCAERLLLFGFVMFTIGFSTQSLPTVWGAACAYTYIWPSHMCLATNTCVGGCSVQGELDRAKPGVFAAGSAGVSGGGGRGSRHPAPARPGQAIGRCRVCGGRSQQHPSSTAQKGAGFAPSFTAPHPGPCSCSHRLVLSSASMQASKTLLNIPQHMGRLALLWLAI